jgi:hypothetical protein
MSNPYSGNQSTIGATLSSQTDGGTPIVVCPIQAHQSTIRVNDENHVANECNGGARGRITRGMKQRKKQARYQGRPLQFQGGDDDGRPRLDDHGILDPDGSQRTRRIVIRNDVLHLRSGLPEHSVVYCDVTERNRVAMSRHHHNVTSRQYDGSRRCCYSGVN